MKNILYSLFALLMLFSCGEKNLKEKTKDNSKEKEFKTEEKSINNMPWSGEDLRELHDRLAYFFSPSRVKFWMTKLAGDEWPKFISINGYIVTQEEIDDYNTYDPPTPENDLFSILQVFCEFGTIESELYEQLNETTSCDCLYFTFKLYEEILRTPYMVVG